MIGSSVTNEVLKSISDSFTDLETVRELEILLGQILNCKGKHVGRFFKAIYTKSSMKNIEKLRIDVRGIHLGHANSRDVIELAIVSASSLKQLDICMAGCSI